MGNRARRMVGESSDQTTVDPSAFNCYEFFKWDELPADATDKARFAHITLKAPEDGFAEGSLGTVAPITLLQELEVFALFLVVFGSFFYVPIGLVAAFLLLPIHYAVAVLVMVVAAMFHPISYWAPLCHTHVSTTFMRYCSYRMIFPADSLLHVPVIRHFVTWMGAV